MKHSEQQWIRRNFYLVRAQKFIHREVPGPRDFRALDRRADSRIPFEYPFDDSHEFAWRSPRLAQSKGNKVADFISTGEIRPSFHALYKKRLALLSLLE